MVIIHDGFDNDLGKRVLRQAGIVIIMKMIMIKLIMMIMITLMIMIMLILMIIHDDFDDDPGG